MLHVLLIISVSAYQVAKDLKFGNWPILAAQSDPAIKICRFVLLVIGRRNDVTCHGHIYDFQNAS